MQGNTTIARPYAMAAFAQAQDEADLGAWSDMLKLLSLVIADPQMQGILDNPRLDAKFLSDFVLDICAERLSETGRNFVNILSDAGRLSLAPQIYRLFEQKRLEAEDLVEIEVVSAYELEQEEQERIAKAMGKRFGKKINISVRIDESLIGGAIIRAGDSVIDASVLGRLKQLADDFAE